MTDIMRTHMEPTTTAYTNTDTERHRAKLALALACHRAGGSADDYHTTLQALGLDDQPERPVRPRHGWPKGRVVVRIDRIDGRTLHLECGHKHILDRYRGAPSAVCPTCSAVA